MQVIRTPRSGGMEQRWGWGWRGGGTEPSPSQESLAQISRIQKTQAAACEWTCAAAAAVAACPGVPEAAQASADLGREPPDWPSSDQSRWLMEADRRDAEDTDQEEANCCSEAFIGILLLLPRQSLPLSRPRCPGNHQSLPGTTQASSCQSFSSHCCCPPSSSPRPLLVTGWSHTSDSWADREVLQLTLCSLHSIERRSPLCARMYCRSMFATGALYLCRCVHLGGGRGHMLERRVCAATSSSADCEQSAAQQVSVLSPHPRDPHGSLR